MAKFAVIMPAAGRSSRFKDKHYKKPFAPFAGKVVWLHSAERFLNRDDVVQVILVISPEDREAFHFKFSSNVAILGIDVIDGGAQRADSVEKGLAKVKPEAEFVCVHDAARPCLTDAWVETSRITEPDSWRAVRGENLIIADPMLMDPEARDFRPRPGSPAIGAGIAIKDGKIDPGGEPVTIGAFPFDAP